MPNSDIAKQLGANIAKKRKKMRLTQAQLAEKLEIGQDALSRMEQGKISPKINRLPALAEELDCSVADLFRSGDDNSEEITAQIVEAISSLSQDKQKELAEVLPSLVSLMQNK